MNLFRGNSQDFHALFTRFSWPKPRLMTHEFDMLWDFHGVQEKAMKYIQIFHGVQIHGHLMEWKIHGS